MDLGTCKSFPGGNSNLCGEIYYSFPLSIILLNLFPPPPHLSPLSLILICSSNAPIHSTLPLTFPPHLSDCVQAHVNRPQLLTADHAATPEERRGGWDIHWTGLSNTISKSWCTICNNQRLSWGRYQNRGLTKLLALQTCLHNLSDESKQPPPTFVFLNCEFGKD